MTLTIPTWLTLARIALIPVLVVVYYLDHRWSNLAATVVFVAVSALREWMAELGQRAKVAVAMIGKIKTTVQMVALSFLLYREPLLGVPVFQIGEWLLAAAAVLTLWSGFEYVRAAWPALRADDEKSF